MNEEWALRDEEKGVLVGSGGFGDVFKMYSETTGGLQKHFARKIIRMNRELGILNETRAIDRLCKSSHPNIVQVLQHGYLGNAGSFYFVDMELCDLSLAEYTGGKTVAPLLDWNSLPQEKRPFHVLTILEQVVDGMIFIHGHREIHRDLHPANVSFSSTGGSWKIADFGLTSEGGSAALVTTRYAYGKPGYRPPEMITALPFRYNNKADIWCVGCIIFELFTGERDDISVVDHARSKNNLEERIWARVESRPYLGRYINLLDPDPNNRPSAIELKLMVKKDLDRFGMTLRGTNMETKSDRINSDPGSSEGNDRTPSPLEILDESDEEVIEWAIDVEKPKDLTISHLQAYEVGGGVHTVSTDGTYLAVSTLWNVQIFDTTRNAKISTFWAAHSGQKMAEGVSYFTTVCFTPDNARLVSGGESEKISIWHIRRKRFGNHLLGHSDDVNSVDVSLDGTWLASGSEDRTVKVWNLDSGGIIRTIHLWEAVRSVAFSPCFQKLIGGTIGGTVYVWSLKSGCITQKLEEHHDNVGGLAFLSNGSELVSASDDNTLRVWKLSPVTDEIDRVDGTLTDWESSRAELVGHRRQVTSVTTSPNGKWIASGSMDKSVRFWNTDDGKGYKTLRFHGDGMYKILWSAG